ncbi:MAG: hypothetical protein EZS26_000991 [Candidatus Ordinivivax streblomastigis]|uniref:Uncharacterized protein n=1 Tax=Candidatus Ordinivivax streblomastigis TaxID=2540710 RepID=A0A5M8P335_9BACT|nr:MAG: hypothetical protein EZS26_000991 [Candidatus Ordinivivax streblomastigis]
MKVETEFTNEQIIDLLTTALEGGSNYWYYLNDEEVAKIRQRFKKGNTLSLSEKIGKAILEKECSVKVTDVEDGDELGILNEDTIRKGFSAMLKENSGSVQKEAIARIICDDYDDTDADVWFQMVIMGEIIYG